MEKIGFDPTDSVFMQYEKQSAKESALTRWEFCVRSVKWGVSGAFALGDPLGDVADIITVRNELTKLWPTPKPVRLSLAGSFAPPPPVFTGTIKVGSVNSAALRSKTKDSGTGS